MAVSRAKKIEIVKKLSEITGSISAVVFADFFGLKTKNMNELRHAVKAMAGNVQIMKKTLAEKGLKDVVPKDVISRHGGIAAIWFRGEDADSGFKAVWRFSKANEALKIIGGYIRDSGTLSAEEVISIAQLPSREVLISRFVGVLAFPLRGIVTVLNGNLRKLVLTLAAIQRSKSPT